MKLYQDESLFPLEVWHGLTAKGPLFKLSGLNFQDSLIDYLQQIYEGRALTMYENDNLLLKEAIGFTDLWLTGGDADKLRPLVLDKKWPFQIHFVESLKGVSSSDLTIDWGQTAIKVFYGDQLKVYPRDWQIFPFRNSIEAVSPVLESDREKVQQKLRSILADFPKAQSLTLALPMKINSDLYAEPCTYAGMEGNLKEVFSDILIPITFINDAVFATAVVKEKNESQAIADSKHLIMTLGYGVGAAIWKK